jgi:hypothetical protein
MQPLLTLSSGLKERVLSREKPLLELMPPSKGTRDVAKTKTPYLANDDDINYSATAD